MGTDVQHSRQAAAVGYGWPRLAAFFTIGLVVALMVLSGAVRPALAYNPPQASIVIDAVSGEVLSADRPDVHRHPASLTKLMTLYMLFAALERGDLSLGSNLSVSRNAANQPPTRLGLAAGSTIRVEDAIRALIVNSANDVAVVVAEALSGSVSNFAEQATAEARRLGMTRTVFRNPHGLPDSAQVTTAADMAILAQRLLYGFPQYYHYFSTTRWTFRGTTHRTHNRLMESYAGMDGMKTGYIRSSGFNLAATAVRGELRLIAIVFGGATAAARDERTAALLNQAFASPRGEFLIAHGSLPFQPPLPPRHPIRDTILVALAANAPSAATASDAPMLGGPSSPPAAVPVSASTAAPQPAAPPFVPPRPALHPALLAAAAPATQPDPVPAAPPARPTEVAVAAVSDTAVRDSDVTPSALSVSDAIGAGVTPAEIALALDVTSVATGAPEAPAAAVTQPVVAAPAPQAADVAAEAEWPTTSRGFRFYPSELTVESWSIQVGAYASVGDTEAALTNAGSIAGGTFGSATPAVMATGQLYRARMIGFSDGEAASAACRQLSAAGTDCLTIAPGRIF